MSNSNDVTQHPDQLEYEDVEFVEWGLEDFAKSIADSLGDARCMLRAYRHAVRKHMESCPLRDQVEQLAQPEAD